MGSLTQVGATDRLAALAVQLEWLDGLLARAVDAARAAYGDEAAADPHRGLYVGDAEVARLLARPPAGLVLGAETDGPARLEALDSAGPLATLASRFELEPFDVGLLVIVLAPELDLRYERLYAYLQDDITRRRPSLDLALELLSASPGEKLARRAHLAPDAPLRAHGLLRPAADPHQVDPPLLGHALVPDEAVVRHVLGEEGIDSRLAPFAELSSEDIGPEGSPLAESEAQALAALAARSREDGAGLVLSFHGPAGSGKRRAAAALAAALGCKLVAADLTRAAEGERDARETMRVVALHVALYDALLFVEGLGGVPESERPRWERALADTLGGPGVTVVAGSEPWAPSGPSAARVLPVPFPVPTSQARTGIWKEALARLGAGSTPNGELDALAARFRLTPGQIEAAAARAVGEARRRSARSGEPDDGVPTSEELFAAARAHSSPELARLARKVEPHYRWEDIVLPPERLEQLREVVRYVQHQPLVFDQWGFRRKLALGKGLSVLFAGPSGTGKTMAADIVAGELGLDLFKIDLASVVSKYVGETEKNLGRIFAEAETVDAILFFDEADALFGRRTEVRDAHDRYANIEVGYLLQRMEEHEGIVILATNFRRNMDEAFVRRLHFALEFPLPDEEDRRRIWERVWPAQTPRAKDVDPAALAERYALAGGNIRNIALASAFLAAEDGQAVTMAHVLHATRREYQKMGKVLADGEFGENARAGSRADSTTMGATDGS